MWTHKELLRLLAMWETNLKRECELFIFHCNTAKLSVWMHACCVCACVLCVCIFVLCVWSLCVYVCLRVCVYMVYVYVCVCAYVSLCLCVCSVCDVCALCVCICLCVCMCNTAVCHTAVLKILSHTPWSQALFFMFTSDSKYYPDVHVACRPEVLLCRRNTTGNFLCIESCT